MAALLFLYRQVLGSDVGNLDGIVRARKTRRLPVVLTVAEVRAVLGHLHGPEGLVAHLLYGSGLRLMEELRLRIHDDDLEGRCITVRCGKGDKDRCTVLPGSLLEPLKQHLLVVQDLHTADLAAGWRAVELPHALERKYRNAAKSWGWQWMFPQYRRWRDIKTRTEGRHHLNPSRVQRAVRAAVNVAGVSKQVN